MWAVVALVSIAMFPHLTAPYTDTNAYPLVVNAVLGVGMKGLLITAFLAAFMSTIDTHLNWGASYMITDVYQRFIKKQATQHHYMIVTKLTVVAMMIVAACIVPFMKSVTAAWEFLAIIMVGSGLIHVARWFWWRINAYTEITALSLGLLIGFTNPFIPGSVVIFGYPWPEMPFPIKIAVLTGIILPISIIVTFLTKPVSKEKLDAFYRKIRPGGFWGILDKETLSLPGKAFSAVTIIDTIAGIMLCYGISICIGYSILLQFDKAAVCAFLALIGGLWVHRWYKREVKQLKALDILDKTPQQ